MNEFDPCPGTTAGLCTVCQRRYTYPEYPMIWGLVPEVQVGQLGERCSNYVPFERTATSSGTGETP